MLGINRTAILKEHLKPLIDVEEEFCQASAEFVC